MNSIRNTGPGIGPILKTTGGLLAGTTILAGSGAAQTDGLSLTIRQDTLAPDSTNLLAEVSYPDVPSVMYPSEEVPEAYHLGLSEHAMIDGDGIVQNIIAQHFAHPTRVQAFPGSKWLMEFPTEPIPFDTVVEGEEKERVKMILAVPGSQWFPGSKWVPSSNWDTDTVWFAPGGSIY